MFAVEPLKERVQRCAVWEKVKEGQAEAIEGLTELAACRRQAYRNVETARNIKTIMPMACSELRHGICQGLLSVSLETRPPLPGHVHLITRDDVQEQLGGGDCKHGGDRKRGLA